MVAESIHRAAEGVAWERNTTKTASTRPLSDLRQEGRAGAEPLPATVIAFGAAMLALTAPFRPARDPAAGTREEAAFFGPGPWRRFGVTHAPIG